MEAKDWKVFLSVPEIDEMLHDKGFTAEECEAIIYICKRAGIKEVVEWLYEECDCPRWDEKTDMRRKSPQGQKRIDCWKCKIKLKEWEVKQ